MKLSCKSDPVVAARISAEYFVEKMSFAINLGNNVKMFSFSDLKKPKAWELFSAQTCLEEELPVDVTSSHKR